jgi:hypothetical protein
VSFSGWRLRLGERRDQYFHQTNRITGIGGVTRAGSRERKVVWEASGGKASIRSRDRRQVVVRNSEVASRQDRQQGDLAVPPGKERRDQD